MQYVFKGWEFYTQEILTQNGVIEKSQEQSQEQSQERSNESQLVYLFRAPVGSTKLMAYCSKDAAFRGEVESLSELYTTSPDFEMNDAMRGSIPAINLNYFEHIFGTIDLDRVIDYLTMTRLGFGKKKQITLLGLGDVGSMLTIGLKLLGGDVAESIGIYDISQTQKSRWEMELNQIAVNPALTINTIDQDALFSGDFFIFCASKGVPKVGEEGKDVRMIQFEENAKLISFYARLARKACFKGIFAVVSDPVDLLCKQVFESSNVDDETGVTDYKGLLPEQVIGFGLGVMDGRARYYSDQMQLNYAEKGRVFGPHGQALIVADDILSENQEIALQLTKQVVEANLQMRELGYKPFVAPALSSGANAIVNLLAGNAHYSANFLKGVYWGGKNTQKCYGVDYERVRVSLALRKRIETTYNVLEDTWIKLNA